MTRTPQEKHCGTFNSADVVGGKQSQRQKKNPALRKKKKKKRNPSSSVLEMFLLLYKLLSSPEAKYISDVLKNEKAKKANRSP